MTAVVQQNSTGNIATLLVLDVDGLPQTGVAYNAAGLAVYYTPKGGTPVAITLSALNWTETVHGHYEVDVPDAAYTGTAPVRITGVITSGVVIGDEHLIVGYNPLAVAVGAAVAGNEMALTTAAKASAATATRTELATELARIDVAVSTRATAADVAAQADIAALIAAWVDGGRLDLILDAINAKSALITTGSVTVTSPVAADGTTITVVQGDDYNGSSAITWTGTSADQWPDLSGATLAFRATMMGAAPVVAVPTVTTATGTQVFTMSLTDTQTATPVGRYRYDVQATLSGGDILTLLRGAFVVQRTYTNEP